MFKTSTRAASGTVVALGVLAASAAVDDACAQTAVEWRVADGGNGHWYQGVPQPGTTWTQARSACLLVAGDLASLNSSSESTFVYTNIASNPALWNNRIGPWIGLYQPEGSPEPAGGWTWVDGTNLTFASWYDTHPLDGWGGGPSMNVAHYCAYPVMPSDGWAADPDSHYPPYHWEDYASYIIEWSADCNNDGVVDYGQIRVGDLGDANSNNIPDCCEQGTPCPVDAVEWRVSDGGNGHWYQLVVGEPITWPAARAACEARGGYLVTPTTPAEDAQAVQIGNRADHPDAWVVDLWGNSGGPWLGGFQPADASSEQPWAWVSGEAWTWAGWAPGEPNGGFGPGNSITRQLGLSGPNSYRGWADDGLDTFPPFPLSRSYIIEWSADCNGDGVVDYGQIRAGELADANANNIPDCCEQGVSCNPCPGDTDASGAVDSVDIAIVLSVWGSSGGAYPASDADHDGIVGPADLGHVLAGWGDCP